MIRGGAAIAGVLCTLVAGAMSVVLVSMWTSSPSTAQNTAFAAVDAASPPASDLPTPDPSTDAGSGGGGGSGPAAGPSPGQPLTLSVPSVGVKTAVRSLRRPNSGTIDPPTSSVAYWISSYGQAGPGSDNTVYIAGHTCRGTGCRSVFSPFMDVPNSTTTVHVGDPITVETPSGTWHYTVTGTELWDKGNLADDAPLWQKVPGRLVLITCFQYRGGTSSQQNFIVYAQIDSGQK